MKRIDVHCHFLPGVDDGCGGMEESLECLRIMEAAGYDRIFCTPHCCASMFSDPTTEDVKKRVAVLSEEAKRAGITIELRPGGELRLNPMMIETLPKLGFPTFGHANKYVLADIWDEVWPTWAPRAIEWLQTKGYTVILAHPERMPPLLKGLITIDDLAKLGILFQGNLGPIGGADAEPVVALARKYLVEGRYFMVGTDGHHTEHLRKRLEGLRMVEDLVGKEKLEELTVTNPGRLWT